MNIIPRRHLVAADSVVSLQDKKLLNRRNLVAAGLSVRSLDDGLILPLFAEVKSGGKSG